ncbi:RNA-directed DNA polymerase, eukaryota, reverse transcriptase zinc-binding domain protein [Tanacetum coccineum]|uniref:RNA-directed DNA polymerase, eukaryota, reverse transcriptase zinc-binding domain protein n=1 Tax=Tanacetum coccineum TaxID=301880 RepID=A0ABQ5GNT2_9ASTR
MHTTMVPEQVKTMKIQAEEQVSRLEDKDVIFSTGSALGPDLPIVPTRLVNLYVNSMSFRDLAVWNLKESNQVPPHVLMLEKPVKAHVREEDKACNEQSNRSASANHVEAKGQIEVTARPVLSMRHIDKNNIMKEILYKLTYMSDDEHEEENTGSTSHGGEDDQTLVSSEGRSNVLGVCVFDEEVSDMANVIGCGVTKLPFKYLDVPVGFNMARRRSGREKDDMGEMEKSAWRVGSWEVLNIYGADGGINTANSRCLGLSNWGAILTSVHNLKLKGIDLLSLCSRKIGNEASTRFWDDIWIGDQSLKSKFPRIFLLDNNRDYYVANRVPFHDWSAVLRRHPRGGVEFSHLEALQAAIGNVVLIDQRDSWNWSLDVSHGFSVASVRSLVDARTLDVDSNATRWIRCIPNKIKVFLWRLSLNKLPSRVNLDLKGIDVGSLLCPICQEDVESVNHIFFSCEMAKALWDLFAKWWELDIPFCDNISDWFTWFDSLKVSNKVRSFIEGVGGTLMWSIWNYRNHFVFSSSPPKKALLWDSIVSQSFLWISSRNPKNVVGDAERVWFVVEDDLESGETDDENK